MSRNGKIIVAMSGGVDSSVAACMLKEQGYECVGVFLRVGAHHPEPETEFAAAGGGGVAVQPARRLKHGCCSATDAIDARAVAGRLGIPFYALNFEKEFERIIGYFVDEYARGRTPNPCVMCNIHVKFGRLLKYADMMDAQFVATGHYARIVEREGRARLARSHNPAKDQTYVLFGIRPEDLGRCMFPLGDVTDKSQVRDAAAALGLAVHDKPDSQEICFVPGNDYKTLIRERRPDLRQPGEIRDQGGKVLGKHDGYTSFTIGQRRGLGVAAGLPIYVTAIDPGTNTVTVGERDDLLSGGLVAARMNWHADPPADWTDVEIKIRHMHKAAGGRVRGTPRGSAEAVFDHPQSAVTPGQAAVFYQGGLVLGGGWIEESVSPDDSLPRST